MNSQDVSQINIANSMIFNDLNEISSYLNEISYSCNDNSLYKIDDFYTFYNNFPKIYNIKFFYAKDAKFINGVIKGCLVEFSDKTTTKVVLDKNIDFSLVKDFDIKSILIDMCIFKRVLFTKNNDKSFCNKFTEKLVKDYNRKCIEEKKKKDLEEFQKAARLHRHQKKLNKKKGKKKLNENI